MAKYKVIVNRSSCIACGIAPALCPEVFELGNDNGKNRVIATYDVELSDELSVGIVPEELYQCVKNSADSCPVNAITIEKIPD